MIEECCCCFECGYLQNDSFICLHPLCNYCFNKLKGSIVCPICRSDKQYNRIPVSLKNNQTIKVREDKLMNYLLYGYGYRDFLKHHLKDRRKSEMLLKVNRYLRNNAFIIHKKIHYVISDFSIQQLFIFLTYNKLTQHNQKILELMQKEK